MNTKYKGLAFATGVAALASMIAGPLIAAAQTSSDAVNVTITPLLREVSVKPGESFTGSIEIKNDSNETQTFFAAARDFTSSEDASTGAPKFLESAGTPAQSVSSWTTFKKASVEIASKGTATLDYEVKVPEAAEPGGHYAAIFASTQAPDVSGGSGVAIAARVGSLLLVTVDGDIRTSAEATNFKTDKLVYQAGPINFTASLKNSGNIHFKPKGTIDIKNGSTSQSITFNENGGNVLPNSVRDYVTKLDGSFGFGRYTATLDATAEAPNGDKIPLAATVSFWVIPWSTVIIVLLILAVLWMILKSGMKSSGSSSSAPAAPKKGLK